MSAHAVKKPAPIRLVFELERADHPRLYDDLIQFHKGTKRVNRLRLLAYDGLLAQGSLFVVGNHAPFRSDLANGSQQGNGDVTNDLFAPALE